MRVVVGMNGLTDCSAEPIQEAIDVVCRHRCGAWYTRVIARRKGYLQIDANRKYTNPDIGPLPLDQSRPRLGNCRAWAAYGRPPP